MESKWRAILVRLPDHRVSSFNNVESYEFRPVFEELPNHWTIEKFTKFVSARLELFLRSTESG